MLKHISIIRGNAEIKSDINIPLSEVAKVSEACEKKFIYLSSFEVRRGLQLRM